jgi:hypothetical protein
MTRKEHMKNAERPFPLTYRERSLWIMLVTTIAVYAWYFTRAILIGSAHVWQVGSVFIEAAILLVVLQVVASIILLAPVRPERKDERDRRILERSTRNSYIFLVLGVWFALIAAALSVGTFWTVHTLLLVLVLTELVLWASQLFYYRYGV